MYTYIRVSFTMMKGGGGNFQIKYRRGKICTYCMTLWYTVCMPYSDLRIEVQVCGIAGLECL